MWVQSKQLDVELIWRFTPPLRLGAANEDLAVIHISKEVGRKLPWEGREIGWGVLVRKFEGRTRLPVIELGNLIFLHSPLVCKFCLLS